MDEFYRKQLHRMNRSRVTGLTGQHRINRRMGVGATGLHWCGATWKAKWHWINRRIGVGAICSTDGRRAKWDRINRRCQKWSVGALIGGSCRNIVSSARAKSSGLDDPTGTGVLRRSNDVSSNQKFPSAPDDPTPTG